MNIKLPAGKYILAVSGGVDSIVLLDLLSKLPETEFVVAHFNHDIRPDSAEDEALVKHAAEKYGLPFEAGHGRLSAKASEETARKARYEFLENVRRKYSADKIITAHHQDDLIETALINIIRGTGRRGLSAISDNPDILRPLLGIPKRRIIDYAEKHRIDWRDDTTNLDTDYLRNYLRQNITNRLNQTQRQELLSHLKATASLNRKIDEDLGLLTSYAGEPSIDRQFFAALPSAVGNELLAFQLRRKNITDFDAKTISRLSLAIRAAKPNTTHDIRRRARLEIGPEKAAIVTS
jgi:tRNA(Ile)-lysidine synthase